MTELMTFDERKMFIAFCAAGIWGKQMDAVIEWVDARSHTEIRELAHWFMRHEIILEGRPNV